MDSVAHTLKVVCAGVSFTERKYEMKDGYGVAVYEIDRAYGGPEEGGWYYDTGYLVHFEVVGTHEAATAHALHLRDGKYRNIGNVGSVNYSGGAYSVSVTSPNEFVPAHFPETAPHYE